MEPQMVFPRFPFLSGLNLLKWRHCCLVQVVTSFGCANSHIVSFFKLTLSENCTCINKPSIIRMNQQHWLPIQDNYLLIAWDGTKLFTQYEWVSEVCEDRFSLTETGSQADTVTPVEPTFCPGHMGSNHHTFAVFALCGWWTDTLMGPVMIEKLWIKNPLCVCKDIYLRCGSDSAELSLEDQTAAVCQSEHPVGSRCAQSRPTDG